MELRDVQHRLDRYGRRVAAIIAAAGDVSDLQLAAGHARPYDGKGRRRGWCEGPT